jgi:kynurenine formamidase
MRVTTGLRRMTCAAALLGALGLAFTLGAARQSKEGGPAAVKGWQKGRGWGWVWGKDDEVGSLNAMTPASRAAALALATRGEVYDLGLPYSRRSYKWPGHSPGEIITFRSPDGMERMNDPGNPALASGGTTRWHSCAVFISDNVATQIDGLGHITSGADHHWYNGFKESEWGGDWGVRRCDASTIPPIVARGVLIDVAAFKKVDALPGGTTITAQDLKDTLDWEGVALQPGDVVLVRTGTARFWGEDGADQEAIAAHDTSGPDLAATKWLVEDQGAMLVGSDTSGYEGPTAEFCQVHKYLLVEQGVHIGEFHNLEALSRAKAYVFCYVAAVNPLKGATAGFVLRPLALR